MRGNHLKPTVIFYLPYRPDPSRPSGTNIRPFKMLEAFKSAGCNVIKVWGYSWERKAEARRVIEKIKDGNISFPAFVYSESSTSPMALTDPNHFPHPFLDFTILKTFKKLGMPIFMFYRDVYWKFPKYMEISPVKKALLKFFYLHEIRWISKIVDVLFLPSLKMKEVLRELEKKVIFEELPPGTDGFAADSLSEDNLEREFQELVVIYVGGITGSLYDISAMLEALSLLKGSTSRIVKLIIVTRENEWKKYLAGHGRLIEAVKDRIEVHHVSGDALKELYSKAHVASLFLPPVDYRKFAMPVKLFEYISQGKPVVASSGTAVADFISRNGSGWVLDYSPEVLAEFLSSLNEEEILSVIKRLPEVSKRHSWKSRAEKVLNIWEGIFGGKS